MGTQYYVGLFFESNCDECNGSGLIRYNDPTAGDWHDSGSRFATCRRCNGKGKLWRRWHYTRARTYEQALDNLLPRLAQWATFPVEGRWLLVWKDYKGKVFNVIDVTRAVEHRINKIMERRLKKWEKQGLVGRLNESKTN